MNDRTQNDVLLDAAEALPRPRPTLDELAEGLTDEQVHGMRLVMAATRAGLMPDLDQLTRKQVATGGPWHEVSDEAARRLLEAGQALPAPVSDRG